MHDAVVWRGVPADAAGPGVPLASPGRHRRCARSTCPGGYFNGSDMPDDADELRDADRPVLPRCRARSSADQVLWMAGMDHEVPPAHLPAVVAALDEQLHADGGAAHIGSAAAST